MAASPPTRARGLPARSGSGVGHGTNPGYRPGQALDDVEELPDDAILEQDLRSAPTHPFQSRAPFEVAPEADEDIVELGQDVIVGEEFGAHRPQPRVPVLQEYSSVVIADSHRAGDSGYPRGERTIVVRDRRALAAAASPPAALQERRRRDHRTLVLSASIAVAVVGTSVVMWLSSEHDSSEAELVAAPADEKHVTIEAQRPEPSEQPPADGDTPTVSIDQLPVVQSQR